MKPRLSGGGSNTVSAIQDVTVSPEFCLVNPTVASLLQKESGEKRGRIDPFFFFFFFQSHVVQDISGFISPIFLTFSSSLPSIPTSHPFSPRSSVSFFAFSIPTPTRKEETNRKGRGVYRKRESFLSLLTWALRNEHVGADRGHSPPLGIVFAFGGILVLMQINAGLDRSKEGPSRSGRPSLENPSSI